MDNANVEAGKKSDEQSDAVKQFQLEELKREQERLNEKRLAVIRERIGLNKRLEENFLTQADLLTQLRDDILKQKASSSSSSSS